MRDGAYWWTWGVFGASYVAIAFGRVPGLRMDRAGIALVGATLMLITGALTLEQAVAPDSIDFKTLLLLFGMMIVVGVLRLSGAFERLTERASLEISTPRGLLAVTIVLSGVLSAFLINDVICVALTPLVIGWARRMKTHPLPHLIGLATAANVGSTGTITGNPQNIYIGAHSGISYLQFSAHLMPAALLGLLLTYLVTSLTYRRLLVARVADAQLSEVPPAVAGSGRRNRSRARRFLQGKAMAVTVSAIGLFFTGLPLELIALGAAAVLLLDRIKPEKIFRQVDWSLLVMFMGLFIVVHAFRVHVVSTWGIDAWTWLLNRPVDLLSLVSAGLSNLVSNVPAVLLLDPVVQSIPAAKRETAWLALAMSSTFAGNLTVLGSVANLIVVESAKRHGVEVSFWEYCKVGVPLTLLTLTIGIAWLQFVHY